MASVSSAPVTPEMLAQAAAAPPEDPFGEAPPKPITVEIPDPPAAATPPPAASEPPAPEPPPQPAKPDHPRLLIRTARALGFTQEQIDGTPTEVLEELVHDYNLQLVTKARTDAMWQARQNTAPTAPAPPPEPEPEEDIDLGIDEKQYTPETIADFKKIAKAAAGKVSERTKKLEKELAEVRGREQQRYVEDGVAAMDRAFAKHSDFFGVETRSALRTDSESYLRRMAAIHLVEAMPGPGTFEQKLDRARSILNPAPAAAPAPEPAPEPKPPASVTPRDMAGRWAKGGVAKPTAREGSPEPKGHDKAVKALRSYNREREADLSAEDAEIMNGFPT